MYLINLALFDNHLVLKIKLPNATSTDGFFHFVIHFLGMFSKSKPNFKY